MENEEKKSLIKDLEHGIVGYKIWEEIIKEDGRYIVEINPLFIEKGHLKVNEPYHVAFKFAKHVCPYFQRDKWSEMRSSTHDLKEAWQKWKYQK